MALASYSKGESYPRATWRLAGLWKQSMKANTAMQASAWERKPRQVADLLEPRHPAPRLFSSTMRASAVSAASARPSAITGTSGANLLRGLDGADTLDGAGGADSLMGGLGNDVHVVNEPGDAVSETDGGGMDLVLSDVSFTLGTDIENLTLTGSAAVAGWGNGLANVLIGNGGSNTLIGGNNILNGGAGADSMAGGAGSDRYSVDNVLDVVIEDAVTGVDLVSSSVNWTLGANIEHLNLLGTAATGFGNGLNNRIAGNAMDNQLIGFTGNDVLRGGDGADTLAMTGANFGGLAAGPLSASNFVAHATSATTSAAGVPQFIYNTAFGVLFFDADGAGGTAALRLANFTGKPPLDAGDILLV